jgi:probable F420-dependent oxidoreductase
MKCGVLLPQVGKVASARAITDVACAAEEIGFDSVWVGDHVAFPADYRSRYPLAADERFPAGPETPFLEMFTTLGFVSAVTSRVTVGTAVCVVPHRSAALFAKCAATADALCEGRLVLGVGSGWLREELELLGAPARRGAYSREAVRMARAAWASDGAAVRFTSDNLSVDGFHFAPGAYGDGIPVWIGGNAESSLSWAGVDGDGWLPAMYGHSPEQLEVRIAHLHDTARAHHRPPPSVGLFMPVELSQDSLPPTPWERKLARGSSEEIVELVLRYGEAGVEHIIFVVGGGVTRRIETIDRLRATMPAQPAA